MKKLLLFLIITTTTFNVIAQILEDYYPFPEDSMIWNIKYENGIEYDSDEIRLGMFGDTLIEGIQYNKIYSLVDTTYNPNPDRSVYFCGLREENKSIYIKFEGRDEEILYDFNLEIGDSIIYTRGGVFTGIFEPELFLETHCDTFYRKVVSIDTIPLIDGSMRRRYHLTNTEGVWSNYWVEGLGDIYWLGLINPYITDAYTNGDSWHPQCYKIGNQIIYLNSNCDDCFCRLYSEIETPSKKHNDYKLYPNPVHNYLFINSDFQHDAVINIYDSTGALILSKATDSNSNAINVQKLKSGIYYLRITNNNGGVQSKQFLKLQ